MVDDKEPMPFESKSAKQKWGEREKNRKENIKVLDWYERNNNK